MSSAPTVVIGDGWAAVGAVGLLQAQGKTVKWITGTGARLIAPLGSLEETPGVEGWVNLASKLDIDCGAPQQGSFLREFRNKAFREPTWLKPATSEERMHERNAALWLPERQLAPLSQVRFSLALPELEGEIRKRLLERVGPKLKRIEGAPVTRFQFESDGGPGVVSLASGDEIQCEKVIFADRWSTLYEIEGVPKPMTLLRKREPVGALQASFTHREPIAVGVLESFFASLPRDAGEKIERHVWGCFSTDGLKSVWTLCLSPEEVEDNHAIAKKLRRLKNTLDKVFESSGLIPAEKGKFGASILEEQVRFEEESLFTEGAPLSEPLKLGQMEQIHYLTDGYGPSWAMAQVGKCIGVGEAEA